MLSYSSQQLQFFYILPSLTASNNAPTRNSSRIHVLMEVLLSVAQQPIIKDAKNVFKKTTFVFSLLLGALYVFYSPW
jgi:hypothetical protein